MDKRKWFLMLVSISLVATMVVGCNADQEDDPATPEDQMQEDLDNTNNMNNVDNMMEETDENLNEMEENLEEPFEDPDNDGRDEMDPNPGND